MPHFIRLAVTVAITAIAVTIGTGGPMETTCVATTPGNQICVTHVSLARLTS